MVEWKCKGELNMGSILVLGGAGYIGSHTVYELIDAGEKVVIVDNLQTGFREAVHPAATKRFSPGTYSCYEIFT